MSEIVSRHREQEPSGFVRRKLGEGAARFTLYVLGVDGSRTQCDAWPASLGFEELRDLIEEKAARVAATGATVCNFAVTAEGPRRDDGTADAMGFEAFRVSSQIAKTNGALLSEPANEAGLLAQLMRHNETNLKTTFALQGILFEQQGQTIQQLRAELASHNDRRLESYKLLEDLLSERHSRELEERKAAKNLEFKQQAVESLVKLLPIAADSIMGKVHPTGAALTSAHIARELFNSLRQDQLAPILQLLDQEQAAQVLRLFRNLAEQEAKEAKKGGDGEVAGSTQH